MFIALLLLSCFVGFEARSNSELIKAYREALNKYGGQSRVVGASRESRKLHFRAFKGYADMVEEINLDDNKPFIAEINAFSLETPDEQEMHFGINNNMTGSQFDDHDLKPKDNIGGRNTFSNRYRDRGRSTPQRNTFSNRDRDRGRDRGRSTPQSDLPPRADWTWTLTAAQQQGQCGACWAFTAQALLQSGYYRATGNLKKFRLTSILDSKPGLKIRLLHVIAHLQN